MEGLTVHAAACECNTILLSNQCSIRVTFRALRDDFSMHRRPTESTIRRLIERFESSGSINMQPTPSKMQGLLKTTLLFARVLENPKQSICRRSQELAFSATSTWCIFHEDLKQHPYKI